jgi:hypothetical protein
MHTAQPQPTVRTSKNLRPKSGDISIYRQRIRLLRQTNCQTDKEERYSGWPQGRITVCPPTTCSIGKRGGGGSVWVGLKVLFIEMEHAKSGLIRKICMNGEAWRFSANFARPHPMRNPLKIPSHIVQLLTIRILISKGEREGR